MKSSGDWHIMKCTLCGAYGVHSKCRLTKGPLECVHCLQKQQNDDNIPGAANTNVAAKSAKIGEKDEANENKVFKMVESNLYKLKPRSLCLMNVDEKPTRDPMGDEERAEMRNERLERFFIQSDFSAKPRPFPWLV